MRKVLEQTIVRWLLVAVCAAAPVWGVVRAYVVIEFFDSAGNPLPADWNVDLWKWSRYGPDMRFFVGDGWRTNNQMTYGIYLYGSTNLRAQVYLRAQASGTWAPQVYTNSARCHEAVPVWVYAGQTTVVQLVRQRPGAGIGVSVSNATQGVGCYDWESGAHAGGTWSDEINSSMEPGSYGLGGWYGQWYADSAVWGAATPVHLAAGHVNGVAFQTTGGVLVCRAVAKEDARVTVSNVYFYVTGAQDMSRSASGGQAAWDDLPRGMYTVCAVPEGADAPRYVAAYYRDALTADGAERVTLWGAHTSIVEVLLPAAVGQITGTISTAQTGAPRAWVEIMATSTDGLSFASSSFTGRGYGLGLPPGAFMLRARARGYVDWYYPGVEFSTHASLVEVTTARTYHIDVALDLGGSIHGMVSNILFSSDYRAYVCAVPASMPADEAQAVVKSTSSMWAYPTTVTAGVDGAYVITGLATGAYRVCAMSWHKYFPYQAYTSWHSSNATPEAAGIVTIAERGAAVHGVDVYRYPMFVPPLSSAHVDVVVLEQGSDAPVEHAAVECTGMRADSDQYGYAPVLVTNESCPVLAISRVGYESVVTSACDGATLTVRLARTSAVYAQVRAGRWVDFTYDWRLIAALPDGRHVVSTRIGMSGMSALNVPAETGLVLLAGVPPGGVSGYANTVYGDTSVLSNAAVMWLARGETTNIVITLQPRPASLVTAITHEAGTTVSVACLDVPVQWAYSSGNWLTQRLAWVEWGMPPGAQFDRESLMFTWVSDGRDYDVYIGRFSPPGEADQDMSGACTLVRLRNVPEPAVLVPLLVGMAAALRATMRSR